MGVIAGEYGDRHSAADDIDRLASKALIGLAELTAGADEIAAMVQAAEDGLAAELAEETPDLAIVAGYLLAIIARPSLVTAVDLDDRFDAYSDLSDDFATLLVDISIDSVGFNRALAVELALTSVITALATVVTTGKPNTRAHAITLAEQLLTVFETIVELLDDTQTLFEGEAMNARYFSQTATYSILVNLVSTSVRFLLTSAYDLRIEKRFTLGEPTAPVILAIREYGNRSIADAFDLLIRANALTDVEILLLEAGREVVIYI